MSLHRSTPAVLAFARYFARPCCPQCGDTQLAPERSEFAGEGLIHHTWECDGCNLEFITTVELNRDAA